MLRQIFLMQQLQPDALASQLQIDVRKASPAAAQAQLAACQPSEQRCPSSFWGSSILPGVFSELISLAPLRWYWASNRRSNRTSHRRGDRTSHRRGRVGWLCHLLPRPDGPTLRPSLSRYAFYYTATPPP